MEDMKRGRKTIKRIPHLTIRFYGSDDLDDICRPCFITGYDRIQALYHLLLDVANNNYYPPEDRKLAFDFAQAILEAYGVSKCQSH